MRNDLSNFCKTATGAQTHVTDTKTKINKKTPDQPNFKRRTIDKYFWTHGACAHNSNNCTHPALGHKNEATFENKLGGSKAFCA